MTTPSRKLVVAGVTATLVGMVGAFEGMRTYAYRDPVGIPTICFGETRGVKMGDRKTPEECKAMLAERLAEFADGVERCVPGLPPQRKAAYTSFAYNVGINAFCRSSIVRMEAAGRPEEACRVLEKYVHAAGIKLPGLVTRRRVEMEYCLSGVPR